MRLTALELKVMQQLTAPRSASELAIALHKSHQQTYKTLQSLAMKGLIERTRKSVSPTQQALPSLLVQVLAKYTQLSVALADSGIPVLLSLPATQETITKRTGLSKSIVYKKLRAASRMSIVKKNKHEYMFLMRNYGANSNNSLMRYKYTQKQSTRGFHQAPSSIRRMTKKFFSPQKAKLMRSLLVSLHTLCMA